MAKKSETVSYGNLHKEMTQIRKTLAAQKPVTALEKEQVKVAIRNLDIARCVLECNQTLSSTDYHVEPWKHLPKLGKDGSLKKRG